MNVNRLVALLVVLITGIFIATAGSIAAPPNKCSPWPACKDDGGSPPPPPPPPPPAESCAGATGVFPSFAYSNNIYDGKHGTLSGHDLFLANSDGDCSIKIHTNNATDWLNVSYRQNGGQGRLVWSQSEETGLGRKSNDKGKPVVKLLDITIADGALSGSSSLSTVYMHPSGSSVGIGDAELSPDGDTIFYSFQESDGAGGWVNSIYAIDVSSCTSDCPSQLIVGPGYDNFRGLAMDLSGQRLYISGSRFGIGFVEVANGAYSDVRTVASVLDPEYIDGRPFGISVGSWDFDGDGSENDVVAFSLDNVYTVDILDVSNCAVPTPPSGESCLASGDTSILRSGIPGYSLSFQSADLLIENGGNVKLVDTDSLDESVLLPGYYPDSAN